MKESRELLTHEKLLNEPVSNTKVDLARQLFISLENQVQVADRKVQAVFGLNAFLVAALSLQSQQSLQVLVLNTISFNIALDLLLKACFLACVCIATFSAIKALTPRTSLQAKYSNKQPSLFFFGDIRRKSLDDFSNAFIGLTNSEAVKEILASSHSISEILGIKYKLLNRSTLFLSIALLVWILIQINKFLG